jgi:16S rRNA (guanine527-N7)-methyltransferase
MAVLLRPFLAHPLQSPQLAALGVYLDLLLRWNTRLNLTAVREPENIVTRHIGESLFAAAHLLSRERMPQTIDLGSGAGFPGLPFKIYAPELRLTLVESRQKKATFLREVIRALHLTEVEVFAGRAESFSGRAGLVILRAVERFEQVLPVAAALLDAPAGAKNSPEPAPAPMPSRLGLLIGAGQSKQAQALLPHFQWAEPISIPCSTSRILLVGEAHGEVSSFQLPVSSRPR